jgi:DNA-binding transcriptional MocR family regulator
VAGGLFMWIKMKVKDSMPLINKVIKDKNVFAVPGGHFMLDANTPCPYIKKHPR